MSFGKLILDYPNISGIINERELAAVFDEFKNEIIKKNISEEANFKNHEMMVGPNKYHIHCYAVKYENEEPFFNELKSDMGNLYVVRYPESVDIPLHYDGSTNLPLFKITKENYTYSYVVYLLRANSQIEEKTRYLLSDIKSAGAELLSKWEK